MNKAPQEPTSAPSMQVIDLPKAAGYESPGAVGSSGMLSYEVVSEDEYGCRIKIIDVTPDELEVAETPDNSGDAFAKMRTEKGLY